MKRYKELGPDEILQAGDEWLSTEWPTWYSIPDRWIGLKNSNRPSWEKRRPLTPAEIVAEERKRFEAWFIQKVRFSVKDLNRKPTGEYESLAGERRWQAWCAALGIDPMGDV